MKNKSSKMWQRLGWLGLVAVALCLNNAGQTATQRSALPQPGDRPTDPAMQAQLKQARHAIEAALLAKDETKIYAAANQYREALGDYAGVPEDREQYVLPLVTTPLTTVREDFNALFNGSAQSRGSRSELAQRNQMELREAGYLALGCLRAAVAVGKDSPAGKAYLHRTTAELDYLISRQHADGFFPYPAQPGGNAPPNVRAQVERYSREFPNAVRDGWVVLPTPDGGFQFDTGVCGVALSEGYDVLHEARYRTAAKRAADWAQTQPLVPNWNYNAFSVWLLARVYSVTSERKYLDSAWQKARLGVLPGQMTEGRSPGRWPGRWTDQHNAKRSYHWIIVRALNALLAVLPKGGRDSALLRERLVLAAERRAADTLRDGAIASESAAVALAELLEQFGRRAQWQSALHAELAAMRQTNKTNLYAWGVYLRYAERKKQ